MINDKNEHACNAKPAPLQIAFRLGGIGFVGAYARSLIGRSQRRSNFRLTFACCLKTTPGSIPVREFRVTFSKHLIYLPFSPLQEDFPSCVQKKGFIHVPISTEKNCSQDNWNDMSIDRGENEQNIFVFITSEIITRISIVLGDNHVVYPLAEVIVTL